MQLSCIRIVCTRAVLKLYTRMGFVEKGSISQTADVVSKKEKEKKEKKRSCFKSVTARVPLLSALDALRKLGHR